MRAKSRILSAVIAAVFLLPALAMALSVTTLWGQTNDAAGVTCNAVAKVSVLNSTTLDIALTNVSPVTMIGDQGMSAWITELDFNLPTRFTDPGAVLDITNSRAVALGSDMVVYPNGPANPAINPTANITLDWTYSTHATQAGGETTSNSNQDTLYSFSAASNGAPIVNQGGGFNACPGAGFGTVHFYVKVKSGAFLSDDPSFYDNGNLYVHYVSGLSGMGAGNQFQVLPPVVDFTANHTKVNPGTTVVFTDPSENAPTIWTWDFGDGEDGASVENPVHQYKATGVYNVSLTASNYAGSGTTSKNSFITVVQKPDAAFTFLSSDLTAGQKVFLTDTSTGYVTAWYWEVFRHGSDTPILVSTDENPDFTLPFSGEYDVQLSVWNDLPGDSLDTYMDSLTIGSPNPIRVVVPEPATLVLLGLGGAALLWRARKKLSK